MQSNELATILAAFSNVEKALGNLALTIKERENPRPCKNCIDLGEKLEETQELYTAAKVQLNQARRDNFGGDEA